MNYNKRASGLALLIVLSGSVPLIRVRQLFASVPQIQMRLYVTYSYNTLKNPTGLFLDHAFASPYFYLYIADSNNHVIREFALSNGTLSLVAGQAGKAGYVDGALTSALFYHPTGLIGRHMFVNTGMHQYAWLELWVNDSSNYVIRHICSCNNADPSSGCGINPNQTATVAGNHTQGNMNGSSLSAEFATLGGLLPTLDVNGNPTFPF